MTTPVGGHTGKYAEVVKHRIVDQSVANTDGLDATHNAFESVTGEPHFVTMSTDERLITDADAGTDYLTPSSVESTAIWIAIALG